MTFSCGRWVSTINNGLRASDLVQLKAEYLKVGDTLQIKESKTGKANILVVNKSVHKVLRRYLDEINPDAEDFLFKSRKGGGINSQTVSVKSV